MDDFARTVGKRRPAPPGAIPPAASRAAMTRMAQYRTRVPKGVFLYPNHEAANRDWERWQLDRVRECQRRIAPAGE